MATEITRDKDGGMTFKKSDPVKKKPGRKPLYIHKCSEKAQLEMMRVIIIGPNGDPKAGLAFKMEESINNITEIKSDISDIKIKLDDTITAARTAASSLEIYKLEVKSFENGKNDAEEKLKIANDLKKKEARESWQRVIWIIMAAIALFGLGVNIYFNIRVDEKQETVIEKMDNAGSPVIVNPRGEFEALPEGYSLKMWPKDFDTDTIIRNK